MEWFKYVFMDEEKPEREMSFYTVDIASANRMADEWARANDYIDYFMIPKTQGKWNYSKEIEECEKV